MVGHAMPIGAILLFVGLLSVVRFVNRNDRYNAVQHMNVCVNMPFNAAAMREFIEGDSSNAELDLDHIRIRTLERKLTDTDRLDKLKFVVDLKVEIPYRLTGRD